MSLNGSDPSVFFGYGSCSPRGSPQSRIPSPRPRGPAQGAHLNTTLCLCPLECPPAPGDRCVVSPGRAQCPWDSLSVPGPSHRVCPQLGRRNTSAFPTRTVAAQPSVGAGGQIPPKKGAVTGVPHKAGTGGWPSSLFTCLCFPSAARPSSPGRLPAAHPGSAGRPRAEEGPPPL